MVIVFCYRYYRFQLAVIQSDSGEKVNIFGGDGLGRYEEENSYDHLSIIVNSY